MSGKPSARPLHLRRKTAYSAMIVITFLGMVEILARIIVEPPILLVHQEHQQVNIDSGLPTLNEVMEYDVELFWRLKKTLREHHVQGYNGFFDIDFRVNTHDHLRTAPFSSQKDRFRILTIGDSCTFCIGVNDEQTWPAQLKEVMYDLGHAVEVINAGVPGYTAFQGNRFLKQAGLAMRPDLVVCCFGVNDGDTWSSRSDIETARLMQLNSLNSQLMRSRLFFGLQQMVKRTPPISAESTNQRPRLNPSEFTATLENMKQLCEQNSIDFVLLVWPAAPQIALRTNEKTLYQKLTPRFANKAGVPVVDLTPAFLAETQDLFVDGIHANEAGCRVTATALSAEVLRLLRSVEL